MVEAAQEKAQQHLRDMEQEMISWWTLSAFMMFAAIGVHSLISNENTTLHVPHRTKLLIVTALLSISMALSALAGAEYLDHYIDSDVLKTNLNAFDHSMVFMHEALLVAWLVVQGTLAYHVLTQGQKFTSPTRFNQQEVLDLTNASGRNNAVSIMPG
jgi:hypothetical protein